VNKRQKSVLGEKIEQHFGGQLKDKTIAIWGLAFKPRTDDIRDAPSLSLINHLLELGAKLQVHDPEAMPNVRAIYGDKITYANLPLDALTGANALAILTEWGEFRTPDFDEMRRRMKQAIVFDGRNLYSPRQMKTQGFAYHCIGKAPVTPK
jgi:UDPglucose 6-dehydrogenase